MMKAIRFVIAMPLILVALIISVLLLLVDRVSQGRTSERLKWW